MNVSDKLHLLARAALRGGQNAILSAEDFEPRQVGHLIDEMPAGGNGKITIRKAHIWEPADVTKLSDRVGARITFDFSQLEEHFEE